MTLVQRWNAEETKIGKFLKKELAIILGVLALFSHGLDTEIAIKLMALPADWIPPIIKYTLSVLTFVSPIVGKFTVKSETKS